MNGSRIDPVRELEHTHGHLTKLAVEIGRLVRAGAEEREPLLARLEQLREQLLQHFANEEEALFPFLRQRVPAKASAVDRLEAAHDTVCGAVVRLAHLAARDEPSSASLVAHYERFEDAYARHSQEEAALLAELGNTLDATQRGELAELLRGL